MCGNILQMGFYGHVMKCVGKRRIEEAKEIHVGGMKTQRREFQEGD